MMTFSHGHQRIALFNGLLKRAVEKRGSLSKGAMELAYDFASAAQLQHALDCLVASGYIAVDLDGRIPAMRILKDRWGALHRLAKPLFLSPPKEGSAQSVPVLPSSISAPPPILVSDTVSIEPPAAEPMDQTVAALLPQPVVMLPPRQASFGDQIAPLPSRQLRQISFHLTADDYEWLIAELEHTDQSLTISTLARQMLVAQIDRHRTDGAQKHRLSAAVMRAAREEGIPLGQFVTNMIAVGMTARDMNRRGL